LAGFSVAGGVVQVIFLRWAGANLARGLRLAIVVPAFLVYLLVVAVLLVVLQRKVRAATPACPHCGVRLTGMSDRVAAATGKCDKCGGQVFQAVTGATESTQ
jgi:predicted RNA-binding Zn-ribbon protein involved in translation (DUF1610 family)